MIKYLILIIPILLISCSSIPPVPSTLKINQRYAVTTKTTKNWGILQNHKAKPVNYKQGVVIANGFDGIGLYKKSTGRQVWKKVIKNGVEATPLIENDKIYFGGNDGVFYCINAETGLVQWTFPIKFEGLGKATIDGDYIYFTTGNHNLYSLYKETGQLKWIYTRKVNSKISVRGQSDILISNDNLFTGFSDGYFVSFNKNNGQINWEKKINKNRRFNDVDSSPVLINETVFVSGFDANLYALDSKTGNLIWQSPYGSHTSILFKDDVVYSSTSKGQLVALNAANGQLNWKKDLKNGVATTPIFYKGYLIYGEAEGSFKVVSSLNGKTLKKYEVGRGIRAEVLHEPTSDNFYVLSRGGNLFSFKVASIKQSHFWPWE